MNVSDYTSLDGLGLAALIRDGAVSTGEVVKAAQAAAAAINPEINAVIEFYDDFEDTSALADGPFRGVPFLVKDVGEHFVGRKAENGSRLAEGLLTEANDHYADLVLASGVNLMGRTNTPEFSLALCADNLLYGATSNPWRKDYSTSGSSGGAGAAVAAGIAPVAHASDMGGSTRGPAAWCGTVGLQPSRGRVSAGPFEDELGYGMAQNFVLTRTVRDTAAMLDCLGKPMPGDPHVIARPDRPWLSFVEGGQRRLKIGFSTAPLMDAPVDPEIAAAVRKTAALLEELGHIVVEAQPDIDLPLMDEGCKNLWYFGFDAWLDWLGDRCGRKVGPDTVGQATLMFYEFAKKQTAEAFFTTMSDFNTLRRRMAGFWQTHDIWLSPTCAQVAEPNGKYGMNIAIPPEEFLIREEAPCQFMVPYNVAGQPALSLPLALHSNGLPIGVQLGARHGEEHLLIAVGAELEQAMPWAGRKPPLHADNVKK